MTVTKTKFKPPDIEGTVRQLSDHMPRGRLWEAKLVEDSNLHTQMHGSAKPFNMAQVRIESLATEFNIDTTVQLIEEWETSVGLPDECLGVIVDLDERRTLVKERLRRDPTVTLEEFQDYVDRFFVGDGIILVPGADLDGFEFEYDFEVPFFGGTNMRFILIALVPPLSGVDEIKLRCILEKITPGNTVLIIIEGA